MPKSELRILAMRDQLMTSMSIHIDDIKRIAVSGPRDDERDRLLCMMLASFVAGEWHNERSKQRPNMSSE